MQSVRGHGSGVWNGVQVRERCEDSAELIELLNSLYFGMFLLLSVEFADPPFVERIEGVIGSVPFRWELADWTPELDITIKNDRNRGS
jgi:hypothetical protein